MPTEFEHLGSIAGVEDRHHQVGERVLRGARHARRLRRRVVTDEGDRATRWVRAHQVRVAKRVGGPVEPGSLAVPVPDDAVDGGPQLVNQLRTLHRHRRGLFVQAGLEVHAVLVEQFALPPKLEVIAAERRSLVAADKARRAQPRGCIEARAIEWHSCERLHAGHQHAAGGIEVPRLDRVQSHIVGLQRATAFGSSHFISP